MLPRRHGNGTGALRGHVRHQRSHQPGKVLVRLHAVSQDAVIAAAPRPDAGRLPGVLAGCLQRQRVVLPAGDLLDAHVLVQRHDLDGVVPAAVQLFAGRVAEGGAAGPDVAVGVGQLVVSQYVFTGFAVAQLSEFGRTRRVHVAVTVDRDGEVFAAGNLIIT